MRDNRESFLIPGTEQRSWTSRDGSVYRIMVRKPAVPPPPEGYPAIYVLDANSVFGTVAETVRLRTRGPRRLDDAVVVGIGYETEEPFHTERRFPDYTVHADDEELPPRKDGTPWPRTGGAETFLARLEHELKPALERELPIDRSRQTLLGHSLGGWFALYALFSGRSSFTFFAAGSPSIWWKNRWLLGDGPDRMEAYLASIAAREHSSDSVGAVSRKAPGIRSRKADAPKATGAAPIASESECESVAETFADPAAPFAAGASSEPRPNPARLLVGVGSLERPHMIEDAREMIERLAEAGAAASLRSELRVYEDEDHLSVLLPFIGNAIGLALRPAAAPTAGGRSVAASAIAPSDR